MPVSDDTLARARHLERPAVEAVLADAYPAVVRIARALTGREGAARQVVAAVMKRSVRVLPSWRPGASSENWFYHHTLLTARAAAASATPRGRDDLLVTAAGDAGGAEYSAFVAAIRKLPPQQAEAFLLHHGERLNERLLGVAMDCSAHAAAAHLHAASAALDAVTAGRTAAQAALLSRAYARLGPSAEAVVPLVRRRVAAALWRRRLRRMFRLLVTFVVLALLAAAVWHWRAVLGGMFAR